MLLEPGGDPGPHRLKGIPVGGAEVHRATDNCDEEEDGYPPVGGSDRLEPTDCVDVR